MKIIQTKPFISDLLNIVQILTSFYLNIPFLDRASACILARLYRYPFLQATGQPDKQCKKLWAEGFCPTHPTNITKLRQNTVNSLNTVCNKQSEFFILSMTELMCTGHKLFCTNLNDFRTSNLMTSSLTVKWVPML